MHENCLVKRGAWIKTADFSVGGLLWIGFSKKQTNKLICISSQYSSLVDCDTGEIVKCDVDYDEEDCVAISSCFPNEVIDIYGQYGGCPILNSKNDEKIIIQTQEEKYGDKTVIRVKICFVTPDSKIKIYDNYGYYTCSFSSCGNYFVLADDGGITVLKRTGGFQQDIHGLYVFQEDVRNNLSCE